MVSPNLSKKTENSIEVSDGSKKLFQVIYGEQNKEDKENENIPKIKISELISKMAFYYEKIRNSVDYKEEYLLRKNAIERILKRHIVIEGFIKTSKSEEISKNLLVELIGGGYLPNNKIPEKKIEEIALIIEKYIKLRNLISTKFKSSSSLKSGHIIKATDELNEKNIFVGWVLAIAASEIEENFGENKVDEIIVSNMYEILIKKVKLPDGLLYNDDLEIQIYLGIYRKFLKFDQDMLGFILFKYFNASWKKANDEDISKIAIKIEELKGAIDFQLNHPLTKQLNKVINQYTVFYTVLKDVISEDPNKVYIEIKNDPKAFPRLIKMVCARKYKQIKSKLWRAAVRSIIYIFLTKSILVILLEIPATKFFNEEINQISLGINVVFPALLLFLIVLFTKIPSEKNTQRIISGVEEIVFKENEKEDSITLRKPGKPNKVMNAFFGIFYTVTFFFSFGFVVWGLDKINFSWVSIIIFLFFLAFVSFFSFRIRKGVKEFIVIEQKDNIFNFLTDFLYTPIIIVGKWLSERFSHINVFVFVLDFIIETPFKIFVDIAEQWSKYVKERKDNIN